MTGQELILSAFRLIDHVQYGGSLSLDVLNQGVDSLNPMIEEWTAEGTAIYQSTEDLAVTTGSQAYIWGTGGQFTSTKPTRIASVSCTYNSLPMPVRVVLADEWAATVRDLTDTGYPEICFYDYGFPTGTLRFYPIPPSAGGAGSIRVYSFKQVIGSIGLGTNLSMPPGYVSALQFNLAVRLAPEVRRAIPDSVAAGAIRSKAALAALAAQILGGMVPPQGA